MAAKEVPLAGFHAIRSVLGSEPERILRLLVRKGRDDARLRELESAARSQGIHVETATAEALDRLFGGNHQGVVAVCRPARTLDENDLHELLDGVDHPPLVLVLDGVTDPHNLGACLRTADGAGVDAVVVPRDRSAGPGPAVSRVAAGAAEVLPLVMVTNLARALKQLKDRGLWVTGTDDSAPARVWEADLSGPRVLVLGSEGKGMRRLVREHCDELVSIPMAGVVGSLNVSVAAGICLYEAVRQRSAGT